MSMVFRKPIDDVVRARKSVRTYSKKALSAIDRAELTGFITSLSNPFSAKVRFKIIQAGEATEGLKLGTYGMIKGASTYVGSAVERSKFDLEALGFEFEKLILFAADMGLGTCWLGGTFTKDNFAKFMEVSGNELFPAVTPIGYPAKMRMAEHAVRASFKANQRKDWGNLFFSGSFAVPLSEEEAGEYAFPI